MFNKDLAHVVKKKKYIYTINAYYTMTFNQSFSHSTRIEILVFIPDISEK